MTLVAILAFGLLVAGVVAALIPKVPGVIASLAGVYLYWYSTGYTEPSTLLVGVITLLGVIVLAGSMVEELLGAKVGGASTTTVTIAGVVGLVSFVFVGPLGMFAGTALTVFGLEYRRQQDLRAGLKAATAVVLGIIGSYLIQLLVTVLILVVMVLVVVL